MSGIPDAYLWIVRWPGIITQSDIRVALIDSPGKTFGTYRPLSFISPLSINSIKPTLSSPLMESLKECVTLIDLPGLAKKLGCEGLEPALVERVMILGRHVF